MGSQRLRILKVSALNLTSEPPFHSQRYIELFDFIFSLNPAPLGWFGHERLTLYRYSVQEDILSGYFGRYTHIDPNSPWWDSDERRAIIDSEGHPVPQVREGIGPNFKEIPFCFFPKKHTLIFDIQNITPHQFFKGFISLLSNKEIVNRFGEISVTVLPREDALESILKIPNLIKIKFLLTIPNPDLLNALEKDFVERMERMGARLTEQRYISQTDKNIEPDDELISMMKLASKNGYVESTGKDSNGRQITKSTKQYPWKERVEYGEGESKINVIKRYAQHFLDSLR